MTTVPPEPSAFRRRKDRSIVVATAVVRDLPNTASNAAAAPSNRCTNEIDPPSRRPPPQPRLKQELSQLLNADSSMDEPSPSLRIVVITWLPDHPERRRAAGVINLA